MKKIKLFLYLFILTFSFGQVEDGCDLPDFNMYLTDSGEVFYNSSQDIGGFQFNIDGATVNGGSGGDSAGAGFVVSAGTNTVLGFSFSGAVVPAGCGTLVVLDLVGNATGLSGIIISDDSGGALDFVYYDGGENGGGGDISGGCDLPDFNMYLTDSGEVFYNSSQDIGGFQFNIDGATVNGGSGGDSAGAGFVVSAGTNTVLGFSFSGAVVPAGCGTLVVLDLVGNATGLSGIIISDDSGGALDFVYYDGGGNPVDTCEDIDACNFGQEGDCEFSEENFDCDGNCIADIDCAGVCGGDAIVDDCGVCAGTGPDVMCDDGSMVCDASDCETNGGGDISGGCDLPDFNMYLTDSGEVFYNSSQDIGGFQFNIDGATVNGGSGGDSAGAGFVVSAGTNTVLGFSFSGAVVPAGCGTLVVLDLVGNATGLSGIIISDDSGGALDFVYYDGGGNPVDTCEDIDACNFGQEGDCEFSEENFDCDGNCIADIDCAGVCGGDAIVDDCGVCAGTGPDVMCDDGSMVCDASDCETNGGGDISGGCDLPDFNMYLTDSGEVFYNSSQDIAGFQFNVDGTSVLSAAGGDATANGFTISAGNSTVLAFSFSGAVIPAGCGTLVVLDLAGNATGLSEIIVSDDSGGEIDFVYYDGGGNGGGGDISGGCDLPDFNMYLTDSGEVFYNSSQDIAGFQFNVDGTSVLSAAGGDATANGFTISAGNSTVLAFSFSGAVIPAGCGTLVVLDLAGNATGLSEIIVSDDSGGEIDFVYYDGGGNPVDTCEDIDACNFGQEGECQYADFTCTNGDVVCSETECSDNLSEATLSFGQMTDNGLEVLLSNSVPLAGFQFNISGYSVSSASGGAAESAGFQVSNSDTTVLGFSLTGASIPAGDHILLYLSGSSTSDEGCLEDVILSTLGGDPFEVTVGDCIELDFVGTEATLSFGQMTDNGLEVLLSNSVPLAGFQFNISGYSVSSASGGAAESAGFQVSNSDTTVLGFSLTGASIPAGDHVLLYLSGSSTSDEGCLEDVILSTLGGDPFEVTVGDCIELDFVGTEATLSFGQMTDNGLEVLLSNSVPLAGFQFNISGYSVSSASGGAAESAGFQVSNSDTTVLGFSLTGASIPAGDHILLYLSGSSTSDEGCLEDVILSTLGGDPFEVTVGDCIELDFVPILVDISIDVNSSTSMDVVISSPVEIAGFQFNVEGILITNVSGGAAESAGFQVSNSDTTVLGFSLTGASIPAGDYVLTTIDFNSELEQVCLSEVIISGLGGNALDTAIGDCQSIPQTPQASVQVVHNSADPTVDVYIDGALAVPGFEYRTATPVLTLPTEFTVGIAPAGGDVIAEFPFALEEDGSYVVVATGLLGNADTPFGLAATATTFGSSSAGVVGLEVYHGSTDAPAVDIWANDAPLLTDFSYGDFSGFVEVPAADYTLGVAPAGGDYIAAFTAPLSGLGGGSAVVFASGFLSGADPAFGLFAALNDGTVLALPSLEQDCAGEWGGDAEVDACGECGGDETDPGNCLQFFTDLPAGTGVSSLVIIQDALDLEVGDEVGLFDTNAILNSGDCSSETGELLVGAGVWTGQQLELVGVASVDNCAFGGFQLPGYQNGNSIVYKVWKASENEVYSAEATYAAGTGTWGELITAVSMLEPVFSVTQSIELSPFAVNLVSINLELENNNISSILSNTEVLIASDDGGSYYVPGFGVDQIGAIDLTRALQIFPSGANPQTVVVEGLPADLSQAIAINPFQVNLISYLPQECMSTDDVFAGYEDQILLVQDDMGRYFVPSFGVMTLTEMCPGDGYSIFLNGANGFDFTYPSGDMARSSASFAWESYNDASASVMYADDIVKTGISHPIILTSLEGMVEPGDELVAYADGNVVGATRVVDSSMPIVLAAWGSYNEYGVNLPGYVEGDAIELRLYSLSEGRELYVEADLEGAYYGSTPITSGTGVVLTSSAVPMAYDLMQNYPNPFNPSTTIGFSVPESAHVTLSIYDMTGRLVTTLVDGTVDMGVHMVEWNGEDSSGSMVSAGVYIYALESADMVVTNKMIFMK